MSIFLFFILIILFILLLCTVVSVFQFLSDLKKHSSMYVQLKKSIDRVKKLEDIFCSQLNDSDLKEFDRECVNSDE